MTGEVLKMGLGVLPLVRDLLGKNENGTELAKAPAPAAVVTTEN
jgi:hypothetical protein